MAHDLLLGLIPRDWSLRSTTIGSDPLVWTPSAARAELDRIRGVLDTVNDEASAAASAGQLNAAEWRSWRRTYEAGHRAAGASSLWGSNVTAARQHEQEALKWRGILRSRRADLVGPPDLGRAPDRGGLGLNVTTLALAAGGVAALGYLLSSARGIVRPRGV